MIDGYDVFFIRIVARLGFVLRKIRKNKTKKDKEDY